MKKIVFVIFWTALITGAASPFVPVVLAGSCCGGGSSTGLIVPKHGRALVDVSFDAELYDGFWNQDGKHTPDPPGSDLRQYRLNVGYAQRFLNKWQASVIVPYVWNINKYSGLASKNDGIGDTTLTIWYEAVEDKTAWRIKSLKDMVPSITLGASLLVPTGISPYDDVQSSFDVTGRGFYRVDGNLLIEKTIQPWNVSILLSYGKYIERPVNQEYGRYVEPYDKTLGDRALGSISLSYNYFLGTGGDQLTGTASFAYLNEAVGTINGVADHSSAFRKESVGGSLSYSGFDRDWSVRISWNHAVKRDGWGENFPTTDILTLGVRYVFR